MVSDRTNLLCGLINEVVTSISISLLFYTYESHLHYETHHEAQHVTVPFNIYNNIMQNLLME